MFTKTAMLIGVIISAILLAISVTVPAIANTNYNLTQIAAADYDIFYNYDFTDDVYDATHVDQPVTILFMGKTSTSNVNKNRIYNEFLVNGFQYAGSAMDNYLNDGYDSLFYWIENDDPGRKTARLDSNGWHYRVYAANNAYMKNSAWNKYLITTTHRDWLAHIPRPGYGWSEDSENTICGFAAGKTGWVVNQDTLYLFNADWPGRWDGLQYWQCDGYCSLVRVP